MLIIKVVTAVRTLVAHYTENIINSLRINDPKTDLFMIG